MQTDLSSSKVVISLFLFCYIFGNILLFFCRKICNFLGISRSTDEIENYGKFSQFFRLPCDIIEKLKLLSFCYFSAEEICDFGK